MSTNQPETSQRLRGLKILRATIVGALACGALGAAAAHAQKPTKGITGGLESGTTLVSLPATPSGSFLARECRDCPSIRVSFDANTRYVIGDQSVSYAKFREAASKGDIRLYVSYRLADKTLTRLRLATPGN